MDIYIFFKSIGKFSDNLSYEFTQRYFGRNLCDRFIAWKIIWGLFSANFVWDLPEKLLLEKLFGDCVATNLAENYFLGIYVGFL